MNFLLNENIPPSLTKLLNQIGWKSQHVRDVNLTGKPDIDIVEYAIQNKMIIITHDLDYGRIVSLSAKSEPSVLTFRLDVLSAQLLFKLISDHRMQLEHYLQQGALLTVDLEKIRYRLLPIER
jgi:predicted nuclease of predicted toxin-antitoxin system